MSIIYGYTEKQIKSNRKRYLAALRRTKGQCQSEMFQGRKVCAVGVGVRLFMGIHTEKEYYERAHGPNFNPYDEVADRLGLGNGYDRRGEFDVDEIWKMNDRREGMSFAQIADALAKRWEL